LAPHGITSGDDAPATVAVDRLDALVVVLDLVRTGATCTRPDMARRSGFGRTVVTQRMTLIARAPCGNSRASGE
jgi:hypothetical protein